MFSTTVNFPDQKKTARVKVIPFAYPCYCWIKLVIWLSQMDSLAQKFEKRAFYMPLKWGIALKIKIKHKLFILAIIDFCLDHFTQVVYITYAVKRCQWISASGSACFVDLQIYIQLNDNLVTVIHLNNALVRSTYALLMRYLLRLPILMNSFFISHISP